jgi:hypothetical protein
VKAIDMHSFGDADVMQLVDAPEPEVRAHEAAR